MIMRRLLAVLAAAILLVAPLSVSADVVRASRDTWVREQPDQDAAKVQRLAKGEELPLVPVPQSNRFYTVQLGPGRQGFVLVSMVRIFAEGQGTGAVPTGTGAGAARLSRARSAESGAPAERERFERFHLALGEPVALYKRVREGYVTAVDARLKIPVWVQYQLTREDLNGPASRTGVSWEEDDTIAPQARATDNDFPSPYQRGHMAPAEDMTRSEKVMGESFIFSNAVPQWGAGFNGGLWAQLEAATRDWVEQRGTLTIIDGPIFEAQGAPSNNPANWSGQVTYGVVGTGHVAVPTHLFKIVIDANDAANVQVLSWVFPNERLTGEKYTDPKYMRSVGEIEALTGLELLDGLAPDVRRRVKAVRPQAVW